MTDFQFRIDPYAFTMVWSAAVLVVVLTLIDLVERGLFAWCDAERAPRAPLRPDCRPSARWRRRGDPGAGGHPAATSVDDRRDAGPSPDPRWNPERITRTREIVTAMGLAPLAVRLLESRRSWLRALALRATGLLQLADRTGAVVASLDDAHPEVRAAALDAIADLRDPSRCRPSSHACTTNPCSPAGSPPRLPPSGSTANRSCWTWGGR